MEMARSGSRANARGLARWQQLLPYLASFSAGAIAVLGFAPWSFWFLALFAVALLAFQLTKATPKQAFKHGYLFGLGLFSVGISWVHISIDKFGGLPLPLSLLLMLLLSAYLALYPALACWCSNHLQSRYRLLQPAILAACWIFSEFLRGYMLTGFPWLAIGYSQLNGPFSGWFAIFGVEGVSLLTVLTAGYLATLSQQKRVISTLLASTLLFSGIAVNQINFLSNKGEPVDVVLVQGNIPQTLRWQPDQEWPTMLKYLDLSRPHYDADLIIWPEAAVPSVEPMVQEYLENLDLVTNHHGTTLISGIVDYNFDNRQFFNTLIVLGKQNEPINNYRYGGANRYQKHHLLPIGEFVPFADLLRPIAPLFNLPMSSFSRGDYTQANMVAGEYQLAPAICYEIAFPEQLRRSVTEDTDFLLTVSNDAWFGDSIGPQQHMEIARARAIELGRPLLRATNTGVTAAVDAYGNEIGRLPMFKAAVLRLDMQRVSGVTPFAFWGHWPVILSSVMVLLITLLLRLRDRKACE
jgi:apolipoprotein N-acyltransferase